MKGQLRDAVGCEASGHGSADAVMDKVKAAAFLATDRVHVLRQAIMSCRKAGTISIPGVYVGMGDKIPLGAAMNKELTIKTGETHVQAYTKPLLARIEAGEIDPSFVVTHPASLEDIPEMYKKFRDKRDGDQGRASTGGVVRPSPHQCRPKEVTGNRRILRRIFARANVARTSRRADGTLRNLPHRFEQTEVWNFRSVCNRGA
jgi:hypothetical protein